MQQVPSKLKELLSTPSLQGILEQVSTDDTTVLTNVDNFFYLIRNTIADSDFRYIQVKGNDTFELVALALIDYNTESYLDALDRLSNIGEVMALMSEDEEAATDEDLIEAFESMRHYLNTYFDDLTIIYATPNQIFRKMRKLFKYKGNLSTVKRVCEELVTWHWLKEEGKEFGLNHEYLPFALRSPIELGDDGELSDENLEEVE